MLQLKKLNGRIVNRGNKIVETCRDKAVLHLGCADYPFSREQYQNENLLHIELSKVSKEVIGVDLSLEGIEFLKLLGYSNVLIGDVEKLKDLNLNKKFDVVVAGEIIEHLSNPGMFFDNVRSVMSDESILLITVPNAHSIKGFIRVLFGGELVHPDHVYYFSQATIEHFCKRYGLEIIDNFQYISEPGSLIKKVITYPLTLFIRYVSPYIADGLIFLIKKRYKRL